PRVLLGRQRAYVSPRDRRLRDDVGLARGGDSKAVGIDRGRRAAADHPDIVGEVGLGQLAAEGIEDSRNLVDRAAAEIGAADTGAVAGASMRGERPAGRAAAR